MTNKQLKILKLLITEPTTQYSAKELSIIFNYSIRSIYRALNELMKIDLIVKIGSVNSGQYIFSPYILPKLNAKATDRKKLQKKVERLKG